MEKRRDITNIKEIAIKAIENFEVTHYSETDKVLRKHCKKAMDSYEENVANNLAYLRELSNG